MGSKTKRLIGVEPTSSAWKAEVIAVIRQAQAPKHYRKPWLSVKLALFKTGRSGYLGLMETTKKVYDFPFDHVRDQVAGAFRRQGNRGTVADVVAQSGLPKHQVETVLPAVVSECRGQMAVTESGEILYKFPQGLSNPEKSLGKKLLKWMGKALAALFKVWIMVMLVGYFVLFVLILLAAIAISIALSFAKRGEDRDDSGGGVLGFYLVARVFEMFVLIWLYSGDPYDRQLKKKKPFHKAIFEFVFGVEERPETWAKQERKAVISFVRQNKGSISLEELMAVTGKPRAEADAFVSRLMLEYEGEPRVSEAGTLHFFFPELLKTSLGPGRPYQLPDRELIPFTHNPQKTNNWIIGINAFNLVLSAYFLGFGLQGFEAVQAGGDNLGIVYLITTALVAALGNLDLAAAESWVIGVLGVVPVAYSAFFFGIPLVRRWREGVKNLKIKTDNLRKRIVAAVLAQPREVRLDQVQPTSEADAPGKPGPQREAVKEGILRDLAGDRSIDVVAAAPLTYAVPDIEREKKDLEEIRRTTDLSKLALGKVVFDTEDRVE